MGAFTQFLQESYMTEYWLFSPTNLFIAWCVSEKQPQALEAGYVWEVAPTCFTHNL